MDPAPMMAASTGKRRDPARGLRVARVAGVDFVADWSLLLIFGLIVMNLGGGLFPSWHPQWSPWLVWGLAAAAAVSFVVSIALHELSHALAAKVVGIPVRRITLFVFGGMAHMEQEPQSARAELLVAVVGPITSIAIGVLAIFTGASLAPPDIDATSEPEMLVRQLGPLATLMFWLGPINVVLGVFNLVPGFPLDGGRVLRAALWAATGSFERATRWATTTGQAVGWTLMAMGALMLFGVWFPVLGGGVVQGVWLLLIGWFLSNAARMSKQQLATQQALEHVTVRDIMRGIEVTVPPGITVRELVNEYVLVSDQTSFPVVEEGRLVGTIETSDIAKAPKHDWDRLTARDVMTPMDGVQPVAPDDDAIEVLGRFHQREALPVVEAGRLAGWARRQDLMKRVTFGDRHP